MDFGTDQLLNPHESCEENRQCSSYLTSRLDRMVCCYGKCEMCHQCVGHEEHKECKEKMNEYEKKQQEKLVAIQKQIDEKRRKKEQEETAAEEAYQLQIDYLGCNTGDFTLDYMRSMELSEYHVWRCAYTESVTDGSGPNPCNGYAEYHVCDPEEATKKAGISITLPALSDNEVYCCSPYENVPDVHDHPVVDYELSYHPLPKLGDYELRDWYQLPELIKLNLTQNEIEPLSPLRPLLV